MTHNPKAQLEFFSKSNSWLKEFKNQKKFAISDDDTNPPRKNLCLYILGGWAINRFSQYRPTKDIDLVADNIQLIELLKSLNYSGDFKTVSTPDFSLEFTQKHTLETKSKLKFSLEARFFNVVNDEIDFGAFKVTRDWLFKDSIVFNERTIGSLEYIVVPSYKKLIVLKFFSAVGRNQDDTDKIIADFVDIHNLQLSQSNFIDNDRDDIVKLLKSLSFDRHNVILNTRFTKFKNDLLTKTDNSIKEDSIIYTIINSEELVSTDNEASKTQSPKKDTDEFIGKILVSQIEDLVSKNKNIITGFGNLELKLLELFKNARKSINLFYTDREMGFALNYVLSYVTSLIKSKITIEINYFQDVTDTDKAIRGINKIRNLKYLGFNVRIIPFKDKKPPFTGVIIDPEISGHTSLLSFSDYNNDLYFYSENLDGELSIKKLYTGFISLLEKYPSESFNDYIPSFKEISQADYIKLLRMVPEYQNLKDSDFSFEMLNSKELGDLLTHQITGIKKFKLKQHDIFNSLNNFSLDKIYTIEMFNNFGHIINIPIIEKIHDKKYIIEGHTRLHTAYEHFLRTENESNIFAVTIDYTNLSIDIELSFIEHIKLSEMKLTTDYKTHPITGKIHNPKKRNIESYTHGAYHYNWKTDFKLDTEY